MSMRTLVVIFILVVIAIPLLFQKRIDVFAAVIAEQRSREIFCEQALRNRLLVWCDPTLPGVKKVPGNN
jgi:hypothetical protein